MKIIQLSIPDIYLIEPDQFSDVRGHFLVTYREDVLGAHGIPCKFLQENRSLSRKGVLRGLHFQTAPREQAKLVTVIRGSIYDVAVDIRKGSPTFGRYVTEVLSEANKKILYIPPGFAHGFCAFEGEAEVAYKVSDYYAPEYEHGILWNDPGLAIPWPKIDGPYLLSDKDRKYPTLKEWAQQPA